MLNTQNRVMLNAILCLVNEVRNINLKEKMGKYSDTLTQVTGVSHT